MVFCPFFIFVKKFWTSKNIKGEVEFIVALISSAQRQESGTYKATTWRENADALQMRMCYDDIVPNWEKKCGKSRLLIERYRQAAFP